ncbi:MAG: AAA-like domain-containing protein, partial [Anaerolineales bacterium]
MPEPEALSQFFTVGGTLSLDAGSYVRRPADEELLGLTLSGEYCNVLTARQMGKSSLMVRTAHSLKRQGVRTSIIDLTAIGTTLSPSEWYFGLLNRISKDLDLDLDVQSWWSSLDQQSPVQRFSDFLRNVVLEQIQAPVVVFIDEIDTTLKIAFTDDFFAAIRAAYNARASDPVFKRLSFVLLGVVRPADLIQERTRTPYNIGVDLDMTDFQIGELNSYVKVMETIFPGQGIQTIKWILDWTGGQPYLTQKICSELVSQAIGRISEVDIDFLVEDLFLGEKARTESNLRSIRDRAIGIPDSGRTLRLYRQVLRGKRIFAQERSVEQNELKLTGLVSVTPDGYLKARNRIYRRVFDQKWASDNIRATTFQKVAVAMTIVALAAILTSAFLYWRSQNQAAEVLAQTYTQGFQESASPEVRITNLAGMFGLGGDYSSQARQLFFEQSQDDQQALLQLASPQNVGDELVSVVEGLYQYAPDDKHGNDLLAVMGENLSQVAASGAPSLATEIEFWLQARELAGQGLD